MSDSFNVKGHRLSIRTVQSPDQDSIKYDVFDGDASITKGIGFTAPKEFFGVVVSEESWMDLIRQEVIRRASKE
jgi:hypothetical protein